MKHRLNLMVHMTGAPTRRRSQGASLIELMVAMTIGLIMALVVVATVAGVGGNLRTVSASSAAQVSVQVGLGLIDEAGRSAGAGFYSNGRLLCPTINAWRNGATRLNGTPLMPVQIIDGGSDTASDTVIFTAGGATAMLSSMPVLVNMAAAGSDITVNDAGLIAAGDLAVVGSPGTGVPCTLFQVTSAPVASAACGGNATSCKVLPRATDPASGFNPPDPIAAFPANSTAYGYSNVPPASGPATVNRIGVAFRQAAFAVQCNSLVTYNAFTTALGGCTSSPLGFAAGIDAVASDIVQMHVQYGVSVDSATDVVASWENATGVPGWGAPTPADIERIKALRVVIVSRSKEPAPTEVTAATCTNNAGNINTGPCSFQDADAPIIDLSATEVPAGRTWQQYRYRVHRAVVPLRNVLWSN